ncbi:MAG: DUF5716 family protein [Treponema sp.]|jgi:hypothetical protein|nr:DUF5716 family protein [Treponema sp.]
MPSGVFAILPENFFSPLANVNREHYAALLVLYYRLFQENTRGLERELVVREFMNYLVLHHDSLKEEDEEPVRETALSAPPGEADARELDFDSAGETERPNAGKNHAIDERALASKFLRRFISTGWLAEETLADFTKVINITAWGKPFMKALADIDGGLKTEYESHVVTVYSMLCGETIKKDGHHAVLKAHEECRSLIDSLKVLSQSIKGYYDNLNAEAVRSLASSVLHEHYDLYMGEVLDKAYKRLKTADNVSRYRQGIFKQVTALLKDKKWLDESAGKYMRILQTSREECRNKLIFMLEEIRDDLKSVDPLEDEIDRRNAAYSRSSTEIIKAYIEPDSTVAGKIGQLIKAIYGGNEEVQSSIAHGLHRVRFLSPSSLAFFQKRAEGDFNASPSKADVEALDQTEKDFFERMKKRLSIKRINAWLDEQGGQDRILIPEELITGEDSYIRFIYALLYGDSRGNFGYSIEETDQEKTDAGSVKAADYVVPDIRFRKRLTKESHEPRP